MDDPGWDTPGFDDEPVASSPSSARSGGGGDSGGGQPPWTQPKWLAIGGGGVALIVIVVLIAILVGRGGNNPTPTPTPLAATSTIVTPSASPTTTPTPSPTPSKKPKPRKKSTGESLASYDHQADVICSEYNPRINPAVADNNLPRVADLIIAELGKIQKLRSPDDDGDEAEKWVNAVTGYWESLNSGNVPSFKQQLQSADSLAIELGMKSCGRSK